MFDSNNYHEKTEAKSINATGRDNRITWIIVREQYEQSQIR